MPAEPDAVSDTRETPATGLAAALGESGAVAAIGARAVRLLDASADERTGAADSAARPATEASAAGTSSNGAPVAGPRFATLADCVAAAPGERAAESALLTLDALGEPPLTPRALDRALGTACRLYPAGLLLFVETDETLPAETLFAFGFRRLAADADGALHEYRLRDYKMPPDWLNARFWANPDRFELDPDEGGQFDPAEDAEDEDEEDDDDEEYEDEDDEGDADRDGERG